jgi:hypothetical protein
MRRALRIVLGIEVVLGAMWTLVSAMAQGAGGLAVAHVFLTVYPLFGVFVVFSAWAFWKHPAHRTLASWTMALPVIFWFLPVALRSLAGGAVSGDQLWFVVVGAIAIALLAAWVAPRRAATLIPGFLVRSRIFNWLLLTALIAAWLLLVSVVFFVASHDRPSTSTSGTGVAYAIVLASIYLIALGVGSLGIATWSWVSLRGGFESTTRRLNFAQFFFSVPGILIAVLVAAWLTGQGAR